MLQGIDALDQAPSKAVVCVMRRASFWLQADAIFANSSLVRLASDFATMSAKVDGVAMKDSRSMVLVIGCRP